ncbi:MAG: AarF/UbiB family protein [Terriglobales bacterium]
MATPSAPILALKPHLRERRSNIANGGLSSGSSGFSMPDPSLFEEYLRGLGPEQLQQAFRSLVSESATREERVAAIQAALASETGRALRAAMGRWIVDHLVPVEHLVPEPYTAWRQPVREAMLFVVNHLSDARLAVKLLEQIELPPNARPETRLLQLIAKVPGLQKLGQVLARNRHLRPALRKALAELENGIHDVDAAGVQAIIRQQLGPKLERFAVEIKPRLLSEASVSAVIVFTWLNPQSGTRERGVFKVLKPHIPLYFAEDMELLQGLAQHFGRRYREYGSGARAIPDTFKKVRRLLQHEVDFPREQKTLLEAGELYKHVRGVRIPGVIRPLCTDTITAMTEETGAKVTDAVTRMPAGRRRAVAEQLVEALVAVPLFAPTEHSLFHADPHAGNLLYNGRTGELIIIDWALRERLSRGQRRQLALLFLMVALRDPVGAANAITALAERPGRRGSRKAELIRDRVRRFVDALPLTRLPSATDAMRLLEEVAFQGVRFPGPLIMLSKVLFTLDGILQDIGGDGASMGAVMARHVARRWLTDRAAIASPLTSKDWITVQCSALLYSSRLWIKGEQTILNRLLSRTPAAVASAKSAPLAR